MTDFHKQFRGYNCQEVENTVEQLEQKIEGFEKNVEDLQSEIESLNQQNEQLIKQLDVQQKTNEEIARLALKEASDLIEKAKRNANMILKESIEYVKGLSKDMDTFKQEAIDFRTNVVKMSKDMIETIDKSEIFGLIREEENAMKETVYEESE